MSARCQGATAKTQAMGDMTLSPLPVNPSRPSVPATAIPRTSRAVLPSMEMLSSVSRQSAWNDLHRRNLNPTDGWIFLSTCSRFVSVGACNQVPSGWYRPAWWQSFLVTASRFGWQGRLLTFERTQKIPSPRQRWLSWLRLPPLSDRGPSSRLDRRNDCFHSPQEPCMRGVSVLGSHSLVTHFNRVYREVSRHVGQDENNGRQSEQQVRPSTLQTWGGCGLLLPDTRFSSISCLKPRSSRFLLALSCS